MSDAPPKSDQQSVADEFDTYQGRYSETVNDALLVPGLDVDYFTRVKAGYILDIAGDAFGRLDERTIADLGCGVGNFHALLSPAFKRLVGIDVSRDSIAQARSRHPDNTYHVYDGVRLPLSDASCDVAFACCVVHHVPVTQWTVFFSEMYRVLRPGGLGLILEHNPRNPLTRRVVDNCPFDRDAVLLKPARAVDLLTEAGFEDRRCRSILSIPSFGPRTRGVDYAIGRLGFGAQYIARGTKRAS